MKSTGSSQSFYVVAVVIAVVITVLVVQCHKGPAGIVPIPNEPTPTPRVSPTPAAGAFLSPPGLPASVNGAHVATPPPMLAALSTAAPAVVALQDGKTIDFSSGKPVVNDSAQQKAIIDAAVKEMDAAARAVTFSRGSPAPSPVPAGKE